jgi:hypothetical protein
LPLEAAAVDLLAHASPAVHAGGAFRADPSARVPRDLSLPPARARSSALATREAPADRNARSTGDAVAPRRAGKPHDPDASADSAASTAKAMPERRAPIDLPANPRSPTPRELDGDASASVAPAAISVEIGRIEVKVAPAPASRLRAAPESFDGYWRLRNYLDRPR